MAAARGCRKDDVFVFDLETDGCCVRRRRQQQHHDDDGGDEFEGIHMTVAVGVHAMLGAAAAAIHGSGEAAADRAAVTVLMRPDVPEHARAAQLEEFGRHMDAADYVCAYNGRGFDLRLLRRYFGAQRARQWEAKLLDPFEWIRAKTGSWVKLGELLELNGLGAKGASGEDAVRWWAEGEYDRVLEYCRRDVECLRDLITTRPRMRFPVKRWVPAAGAAGAAASSTSSPPPRRHHETTRIAVLRWDKVLEAVAVTVHEAAKSAAAKTAHD